MDCWCFKRDFDKKVRELETDVGSLFILILFGFKTKQKKER